MENPFRISGTVTHPYFADRESEVQRIVTCLQTAGSKLLVYGDRRMGKTSAICRAADEVNENPGGAAIVADLSTASTASDIANRIMKSAAITLGRSWKDIITDFAKALTVGVKVGTDPVTGFPVPGLDLSVRQGTLSEQQETLGGVLDTLNEMAGRRGRVLGLVLDEFQEIHRFGAEQAEWHLRGVIQHHRNIAYVLAGSEPALINRMLGKGRAFYGILEKMEFGAIDAAVLGNWIDDRITEHGVTSSGTGAICIQIAGPRTRDVIQLARKVFDIAVPTRSVQPETIEQAFREVIAEEDGPLRSRWAGMTERQQNLLRALAGSAEGITTKETLKRYSLGSSSAATQALQKFQQEGLVVQRGPSGYVLDNPFFRGWVIEHALPDVGLHLPITFRTDPDEATGAA